MTSRRHSRRASVALACIAVAIVAAGLARADQSQENLANDSLESLMNIQVTSVSKTEQKLSQTAAAVFVITQEDIARSGATNIPDLLRMVPGMDVAQINANTWAISARGFNARFSNELQVLVDGRSVYTDSFGGVFWDQLDLPLEDIERIEVIRGPGGSIWGGNSVNGVINIITKKASATKGAMVVGGGGTEEEGFGTLQYGGPAGKSTDYRVFAKYLNQGALPNDLGQNGGDGWHSLRGGFRSDSVLTTRDTLMVQGDLYTLREGTPTVDLPSLTLPAPIPVEENVDTTGGFLQGVWKHEVSARSDTTVELSYEEYKRDDVLRDAHGTLDLNFQHHFLWGDRQNVLWGGEYRRSMSNSHGDLLSSLNPPSLDMNLYSGFVQDEIELIPEQLTLTLGTRLEHNYYSGYNVMPSARAAWTATSRTTLWGAASRSVRTPSEVDADRVVNEGSTPGPGGIPEVYSFIGNPNLKDEGVTAFEAGFRSALTDSLTLDLASYYNLYDDQYTVEPAAPFFATTPAPPHFDLPYTNENLMHGETDGLEAAVNWQPIHTWTLSPGYAFEQIHMHVAPTSQDAYSAPEAEGSSPTHSAQLRSNVQLWRGLSWDASAYFVDRIQEFAIPSYTRVDSQLSWNFREGETISLVGQNLAHDHHFEFYDFTETELPTMMKRSVYAKFTARF